jgi:hypothetical protein
VNGCPMTRITTRSSRDSLRPLRGGFAPTARRTPQRATSPPRCRSCIQRRRGPGARIALPRWIQTIPGTNRPAGGERLGLDAGPAHRGAVMAGQPHRRVVGMFGETNTAAPLRAVAPEPRRKIGPRQPGHRQVVRALPRAWDGRVRARGVAQREPAVALGLRAGRVTGWSAGTQELDVHGRPSEVAWWTGTRPAQRMTRRSPTYQRSRRRARKLCRRRQVALGASAQLLATPVSIQRSYVVRQRTCGQAQNRPRWW